MVESVVLLRVLHSHHVANVLDNAYRRAVAASVGAYRADVRVADIVANLAVLHLLAQTGHSSSESVDLLFGAAQQVEHKSQGCLATYAGQLRKLAHCLFKQLRWVRSLHYLLKR